MFINWPFPDEPLNLVPLWSSSSIFSESEPFGFLVSVFLPAKFTSCCPTKALKKNIKNTRLIFLSSTSGCHLCDADTTKIIIVLQCLRIDY